MHRIAYLFLLALFVVSTVSSAYAVVVYYPSDVLMGQPFTVSFGLATSVINSTKFEYVTPGTEIINVSGGTAYRGFGSYWMVDRVNLTGSSAMLVSFRGEIVGSLTYNPGIVLYGNNFNLNNRDGQINTYEVLVAWSGRLWVDSLNGWTLVATTLPTFTSGEFDVLFKNVDGYVCVYSITVNSRTYLVEYKTSIPWSSIAYVGIRPDTDTVLPEGFTVVTLSNAYYVVYLNGKEFASGYTEDGFSKVRLTLYSPVVLNVTFPQYNLYKVVVIPPKASANAYVVPSVLQVPILTLAVAVLGFTVWRDLERKKSRNVMK